MAEYKNFSRCVICRSKKTLNDYNGDFEVTMLLNTLYMVVMYPLEKRKDLHIKGKNIAKYLEAQNVLDTCGNEYKTDDIIRYLRNGLAHFNIKVTSDRGVMGQISDIKISAKNLKVKPKCQNPCETLQCQPQQYQEKDGAICIFNFNVKLLRDFTNYMIDAVLKALADDVCKGCPYQENNKDEKTNR